MGTEPRSLSPSLLGACVCLGDQVSAEPALEDDRFGTSLRKRLTASKVDPLALSYL